MRMKWMLSTGILIGMAVLSGAAAQAQDSSSTQGQNSAPAQEQDNAPAQAQNKPETRSVTDVGLSFYKTFTSASSGNGTKQNPSNSAGGLLEVRHIANPWVGYEFTYSFNPYDQSLSQDASTCGNNCYNQPPVKVTGKASEISLDWVVSRKIRNFRPFAVGGLGFFITSPGYTLYSNNTVVRPTYVIGGGTDWDVLPHLGLRFQFRDNFFNAPNIYMIYPATGVMTHSAEPMVGAYYRF